MCFKKLEFLLISQLWSCPEQTMTQSVIKYLHFHSKSSFWQERTANAWVPSWVHRAGRASAPIFLSEAGESHTPCCVTVYGAES